MPYPPAWHRRWYAVFRTRGEAIDSLAVLPFANVGGNPDTDYLSDGIVESLIDSLSELPSLKVTSFSRDIVVLGARKQFQGRNRAVPSAEDSSGDGIQRLRAPGLISRELRRR